MIAWLQRHPLSAALMAAIVLLAALIGVEVAMGGLGGALPAAVARKGSAAEAKVLPPLAAVVPEQAYPEMATRPLFTPTRRPAPEPVVQPTVVKGQFVLMGIITAGNTRIAMLREKASGKLHRVEAGKDINGIRVAKIDPEVVTLGNGPDAEILQLQVQRPVPAPPGPPPVVAPFSGPFQGAPPGAAPGTPGAPAQPGAAPAVPPLPSNMAPFGPAPTVAPSGAAAANQNPLTVAVPQDASQPVSPEELLARRRARRVQQPQ